MSRPIAALSLSRTLVVLVVIATLASASAARADKDATTRAPSAELVRAIVPQEAYDAMLDQMYDQILASVQRAGGGVALPTAKQRDVRLAVKECFPYDDLLSWTADVYTKHFSKKELDEMAAFYRTPTGKKLARLAPSVTGEVGAKIGPLLMTRIPDALKKHGIQ